MQVELLRPVAATGGEGFMVRLLDECGVLEEEDPEAFVEQRLPLICGMKEAPSSRPSPGYSMGNCNDI